MKKVGQCLHLAADFICTEGRYQNFPCPYRSDIQKCGCSIEITQQMADQWEKKGYIFLALKEKSNMK